MNTSNPLKHDGGRVMLWVVDLKEDFMIIYLDLSVSEESFRSSGCCDITA